MNMRIIPGKLSGTVLAPVSKSSAHRLLICAALAPAVSTVKLGGAASDDIAATRRCLEGLGAVIADTDGGVRITPVSPGSSIPAGMLDCGESGSTLRFLIPVAAALGGERKFILRGRLPERPLSPLKEELERHGARIDLDKNVLTVCGDGMTGGEFVIDGGISSQFISGLLFALPLFGGESFVRVTGRIESRPYVDMTKSALYNYGVKITEKEGLFGFSRCGPSPECVSAEGDWSGAAFWICAGAMSDRGIYCRGLDPNSLQGDKRCVELVREMGAHAEPLGDGAFVRRKNLRGIRLDAADIPDLVPVAAALAAASEGETVITGAARLRLKESDRIETVCSMISAMGGRARASGDGIIIAGGLSSRAGITVDSAGDHRIAMAAAVLSCAAGSPVTILGSECVAKSYPAFWKDFTDLGGRAEATEEQ